MKEHKQSLEFEKAFDRVVFGTNDPKVIDKKLDKMEQFLRQEQSSLGHSLAGIRHRQYWSLETAAQKAGVPLEVWRNWESDLQTPSAEELQVVLKKLSWSFELPRFLALRKLAGRVRLERLTTLCPSMMAARGVSGVSGSYEWRSLDAELKERLRLWGESKGLSFPDALVGVLAGFESDEEREAWMNEVLGEDSGDGILPTKRPDA